MNYITCTLQNYSITQAVQLIKERGGKVSDSVTKKTDFVVVGESPGSKADKAKTLGVTLLSESDFEQRL